MKAGGNRWIDTAVVAILIVSFGCWLVGLAGSPLFHPDRPAAPVATERSEDHDPTELALARVYWDRYPDVANHSYFGENGVLGSAGARTHYQLHGKAEGRRWGTAPAGESRNGDTLRSPRDRCSAKETTRPNR